MTPIEHFREIVTTSRRAGELASWPGKVIGTFCNFVPDELVLALGAVPVRLCSGDHEALPAADGMVPRDVCSVVRATAGAASRGEGLFARADLLVMPTPCDGKKKLGPLLAASRPVHILDLPARKTAPGAREFWHQQVRALQSALEAVCGQPLTRPALREAIALTNRRHDVARRLQRHCGATAPRLDAESYLLALQASFTDDPRRWVEQAEALADELDRHEATQPAGGPRVLLTGAPTIWPNHKVNRLLAEAGAQVVADETCAGTQRLYEPVEARETSLRNLVEAVADKHLLPCTCPCFADSTDRVNRLLELADEFAVQGVVYHSLRLCALFDMEALTVQQAARERGLPMLVLNTDFSQEDTGQLRTRVQAFVEMLQE